MQLDVRLPIGVMFLLLGLILAVTGAVSNPETYARSLGINLDLWWGLVMGVFGLVLLLLAWRKRRSPGNRRSQSSAEAD